MKAYSLLAIVSVVLTILFSPDVAVKVRLFSRRMFQASIVLMIAHVLSVLLVQINLRQTMCYIQ